MGFLIEVPLRSETVRRIVDDAIASLKAVAIVGEPAEHLHPVAIDIEGLVVTIRDPQEGLPKGELRRVAVGARPGAKEVTCGKVSILGIRDHARRGERLECNVEVA